VFAELDGFEILSLNRLNYSYQSIPNYRIKINKTKIK